MIGSKEPKFKPGDSVVYTSPDGLSEVYTITRVLPTKFDEIFYEVKETDQRLPESALEPYVPEKIFEVTLEEDIIDVGDRVNINGYEGEFEVVGVEERYYFDSEQEYNETVYTVQHISTGSVMFAVEEDVVLADGESDNHREIDELLDEANDYRRLYEMFGDARYKDGERAAYEKLRKKQEG